MELVPGSFGLGEEWRALIVLDWKLSSNWTENKLFLELDREQNWKLLFWNWTEN